MSELLRRAGEALLAEPPAHPTPTAEIRARASLRGRRRTVVRGIASIGVVGLLVGALSAGRLIGDNSPEDRSGVGAVPAESTTQTSADSFSTSPLPTSEMPSVPPTLGSFTVPAGADSGEESTCANFGCGRWDPIPIAPGVADYYAPALDLGEATANYDLLTQALRCAAVDASGVCQQVEGMAGVALVSVRLDNAVTADTDGGKQNASTGLIEVGTTFTSIDPQRYAEQWAVSGAGISPLTPTIIRGHDAFSWEYNSTFNVVWRERAGALAWVSVTPDLQDRLLDIAESIRAIDGPTELGISVVVPGSGPPWDAQDNDGTGFVIARHNGQECLGWRYIDSCGSIAATAIPTRDGSAVYGHAQGAAAIEVVGSDSVVRVSPLATPTFGTQVFVANLIQDTPTTIRFLDASGSANAEEVLNPLSGYFGRAGGVTVLSGRMYERLWSIGADLDADESVATKMGQTTFFRPGDDPVMCVYFELTDAYRVVCVAPGDLSAVGRLDGFVFGSVGLTATRVTVDGTEIGLMGNDQFTDRRFFVAADGEVKIYAADGEELNPDPIVATSD
jgi:hypothetical protein